MRKSLWRLMALLAVFGLLAAACGDDDDSDDAATAATTEDAETAPADGASDEEMSDEEETPEEDMPEEDMPEEDMPEEDMPEEDMPDESMNELGDISTIKLVINPWTGSAVNIHVAKQLLEHIGYEVEVTDLDENVQWAAINTGDQHASLEVWPSGHADNVADFIDNPDGNVVDAGLLGPLGEIGWYMPAYMLDRHPELATVEGFQDPELAGLFATAETGDRGQILHGDPSWVSFEQDLIDELGLHLEITYGGSEAALLASFESAFAREEPVLAYFWTPHVAFAQFDLVPVGLPEGYYPPDNLFKIAWAGLEEGAPAAWNLLHNFNYTTADQVSMLGAVELDEMSAEDAAAAWIAANEDVWSAWIA